LSRDGRCNDGALSSIKSIARLILVVYKIWVQPVLSTQFKVSCAHGSELSVGKRKGARPIATRQAMHVVMRASQASAGSPWSLHRHARLVTELLGKLSHRYGVKVYEVSNNGNHLHLLVRAHYRQGFRSFLRVFAGQLAHAVSAKLGRPV
jgi:hypothetical protein